MHVLKSGSGKSAGVTYPRLCKTYCMLLKASNTLLPPSPQHVLHLSQFLHTAFVTVSHTSLYVFIWPGKRWQTAFSVVPTEESALDTISSLPDNVVTVARPSGAAAPILTFANTLAGIIIIIIHAHKSSAIKSKPTVTLPAAGTPIKPVNKNIRHVNARLSCRK